MMRQRDSGLRLISGLKVECVRVVVVTGLVKRHSATCLTGASRVVHILV